jgi:hypothetical protein
MSLSLHKLILTEREIKVAAMPSEQGEGIGLPKYFLVRCHSGHRKGHNKPLEPTKKACKDFNFESP